MSLPKTLLDLKERFEQHRDSYKSGHYNETQLRREFLDPFFKTLGWDIDNEQGYAEAYKDVIHEDAIRIGGAVKAPDYCFRIGGTRKFFLEAKKPSVSIKDEPSPAYQLRRYAWSAKLPLSILSDFDEFAVYDCRVRPDKTDKASTARIFYCTAAEYAEKWDWIAGHFSRDAVLKGSFDKFAESAKSKRGTAEVDTAFLAEIENWRMLLAGNLALRNTTLSQRQLNFAVQRIIDRIIFLRICEDRSIENYGQLRSLTNGNNVYHRLCQIFQAADDRYNSGLFHFKNEKGRHENPDEITLDLAVDDKLLREMLHSLYYPDSPYEFSVLPADILGQVYEQFLGKVIRLTTGHRAIIEDKPEVKKAGGVYYTPTYIVDYIVKNTIGTLVGADHTKITPKDVTNLRILDPACGSGSFLIGAYQFLIDWHLSWYMQNDPTKWTRGRNPTLVRAYSGEWKLTIDTRKRILLNNIYGVDIDSQAVEVTKLSLLLKVLEGETEQSLQPLRLFHERALPDLGDNIKCGNSLVDPDFYAQQDLSLDEEERFRINVFDWRGEYPEVFKTGGFDAVIGNPPYVRQESLSRFKDYFKGHYTVYHGVADLYAYFIERGITMLRSNGIFSFIVANKWLLANYGKPLRLWLKSQRIEEIIDFGALPVFKKATIYPCIIRVRKEAPSETFRATRATTLDFISLDDYVRTNHHKVTTNFLNEGGWSLLDDSAQTLFNKIKSAGVPLGAYVEGQLYYGIKTGLNDAFVIDAETRQNLIREDPKCEELIKPFLVGEDIKRYHRPNGQSFFIFTRRGINIKDYPVIEHYLSEFKDRLMPKPFDWKPKKDEKWKGRKPGPYKWYEIQDTIDYWQVFEKPKILWPGISDEVTAFALDESGLYGNDNNQLIISGELYLLGILNSRVMRFILTSICDKVQGGFYRLKMTYVEQLPIRPIDFSNKNEKDCHDHLVTLVEQMLTLHKQLSAARTPQEKTAIKRQINATDNRIDQLVYDLYELTPEEIAIIVEGSQ